MSSGQRFDTAEIDVAKHRAPQERRRKKRGKKHEGRVPGWIYRVIVILVLCVVSMLLWFNRSNLTPSNVLEWVSTQVVGMGVGDGYPYSIAGSVVSQSNFKSVDKELLMLRDTELTVLNSTAKEVISRPHSFSSPVMKANGPRVLIYNLGGKGYQIESQSKTLVKTNAEQNILAGALAANGRYALATQAEGYCGCLTAYTEDNKELFRYWFSDYYPTAVALNADGTGAVVTGISAKDGGLTSAVYLLSFSNTKAVEPFAVYSENMILDAAYFSDGTAVAVGDKMTAVINTNTKSKVNYDYQGLQLAAYDVDDGRTALSLSPYKDAEDCRLVVLNSSGQPTASVSLKENIKSVSLFGGTVAALGGGKVNFYSAATASELGSCSAGSDAKAISLCDEGSVYILGVSEVRLAKSS